MGKVVWTRDSGPSSGLSTALTTLTQTDGEADLLTTTQVYETGADTSLKEDSITSSVLVTIKF